MRLRKIKLSGFKSFVDPTTLLIPGNLVGIVGPNGCGKSNIIDAVMWVMGESSAKQLRGDALTDVIFNGSTFRQPVGQASVELIFDNSEGRAGGQYASYSEIQIKRQITREGISIYFLNGTRCRRKDIHAIFLGTGLGPRSYSIIEQGMISRFIEAKPEDLRMFIEEAAGISKYRERRRETENRILHTRDNMARLNDIRDELERQLGHLQRQARAAERYQTLKQEERRLNAELMALNWQALRVQDEQKSKVVREHENNVEKALAALRQVEVEIERGRDELAGAGETHNAAQMKFYEIGGEISQLEQKIQHCSERADSLESDLGSARETREKAEQQQKQDQQRVSELADNLETLQPRLQGSRTDSNSAYDVLNQAEQALQGWQSEWDALNNAAADLNGRLQVEQTRQEHLQDGISDVARRREVLESELEQLSTEALEPCLENLVADAERMERQIASLREDLESRQSSLRRLRHESDQRGGELAGASARFQELSAELASLKTLQQADLRTESASFQAWLEASGLADAPRLIEKIEVEPEWALAIETVLGERLQYYCAPATELILSALKEIDHGKFGFVNGPSQHAQTQVPGRLTDKVSSKLPLPGMLADVHTAENFDEAVAMRADLGPGESVVTQDGVWMTADWIRVNRPAQDEQGILWSEQRIQELEIELKAAESLIHDLEAAQENTKNAIGSAEEELQNAQQTLHAQQEEQASVRARLAETRARSQAAQRRHAQITEELDTLETSESDDQLEVAAIDGRMERIRAEQSELEKQREQLNRLRSSHQQALEAARARWQESHEQSHEIALRLESISSQRASLDQAIQRTRMQISSLEGRIGELEENLEEARAPLENLRQNLKAGLQKKIEAEKELTSTRERVQSMDAAVREKERARTESERELEERRAELENVRIHAQEVRVRLQTVKEQLQEGGNEPEQLLAEMEEGADAAQWRERLEGVERKIHRLGPINLAAIDEFKQLSERKTYLDDQHRDLSEALTTLENAIQKIDKESRTRFKETFDRLNDNLKEMFPTLFGGGHAYLQMTGENILETGVTVMARPPGKRNSNIHLLSGGEKALTAVAIIFSIFKLNPAPFCILDEVDAPMDDVNVGRFSSLITQMSEDVQFIVITHNKITMEIAQQLLGVTMQEAGVSRLVSVDMDEAVQMAATA